MPELVSVDLLVDYLFENIFVPEDRKQYLQIVEELEQLVLERVIARSSFDKDHVSIEFTQSAFNCGQNFYGFFRLYEVPVHTDIASILAEIEDIMDYAKTKIVERHPEVGLSRQTEED